jgi:hypothetical protein
MPGIRRIAVAVALGSLAFRPGGAGAGDAKDDLPGKAALGKHEAKQPFLWSYLLPEGRTAAAAPVCRLAKKVAGANLVFADLDGNGRFDDPGVDGWTVEGNAYLVPFETPLVVGAQEVRVQFAPDSSEIRFRAAAIPGTPACVDGLALLNELRLRNGIPPVSLDAGLSRACELHSAYCSQNGITHDEVRGRPGYTEEGERAGKASSVAGTPSPSDAVAALYCEFYHRFSVTDPWTRTVGIGVSGHFTTLDGSSSRADRPWRWPVVVPAPGTAGQPRDFDRRERPVPYPERLVPGLPITLLFTGNDVREVKAELRAGPKGRAAVPFLLSWPGNPANPAFPDNFSAIALIPEARLEADTAYSYRVSFVEGGKPGEVAGEFTTGKAGGALPSGR